jgi:hypothetical protein
MKKNHVLLTALLLAATTSTAQTQFWSDTFEDAGAPSSGTRTPSVNNSSGGPPATRYFWRCGTSNISSVNVYGNVQGSKFWAGEDHRLSPISQSGHQNVTWTGINISGKSGLIFKGMLAVGNTGNAWDIPPNSPVSDYIIIEYRIDGGAWVNGLRFFAYNPTVSTPLSLETTGDSVGEGVTMLASATFAEWTFNIPTTGTTLDLRLKSHSNATSEEWAADNFRLFYTSALPVEVSSFDVNCDQQGTLLNWSTESEYNFSHYEIEESDDLASFRSVGMVSIPENAVYPVNYQFRPVQQPDELHYYRLKAVDNDGSFAYYGPVSTACVYEDAEPVFDHYLVTPEGLRLFFHKKGLHVELLDVSGRSLFEEPDSQSDQLQIVLRDFPPVVILRMVDQEGKTLDYKRLFTQ